MNTPQKPPAPPPVTLRPVIDRFTYRTRNGPRVVIVERRPARRTRDA